MFVSRPPEKAPDRERARHPSWRRYTAKYQRKRRIVRDMWLGAAVLTLGLPVAAVPVMVLGTTFIAFMILDETP